MITVSVFLLVAVGLALFIGGQFFGQRQVAKKAAFMENVFRKSFESYQEAIGHVITSKGMDYKAIEQEALSWTINNTTSKIAKHLKKLGGQAMFVTADEDTDASQKNDKSGGDSGPNVH